MNRIDGISATGEHAGENFGLKRIILGEQKAKRCARYIDTP
jgi:hypothetical protein